MKSLSAYRSEVCSFLCVVRVVWKNTSGHCSLYVVENDFATGVPNYAESNKLLGNPL